MVYDYTKDPEKVKSVAMRGYDFYIPHDQQQAANEQKIADEKEALKADAELLAKEKKEFEEVKKVEKLKKAKPVLTDKEKAIKDLLD
jgi:hypothetical protein